MVGTISPVVYEPSTRRTWYRDIAIYSVSQVGGAAVTGLAVGGLALLTRAACSWQPLALSAPLGILCAIGALHDLKLLPFRLPSRCWQVPQSWKRFRRPLMAACYGFGIGLGMLTRIPFGSFYVVLLACASLQSLLVALVLMVLYGMARATTVALVAGAQALADQPQRRLMHIVRFSPLVAYFDGLTLSVFSGLLLSVSVLC